MVATKTDKPTEAESAAFIPAFWMITRMSDISSRARGNGPFGLRRILTKRLKTNQNAICKVIHDARKKICAKLMEHGYSTDEIMALFSIPSTSEETEKPEGDCL